MNHLEFAELMRKRTKTFAIGIIKLFGKLPKSEEARIIGRQMLRSGTSVAANYRAACRAKSQADFISKMGTVVEESDETVFWLELLEESGISPTSLIQPHREEALELLRIFTASLKTARSNRDKSSTT